MILAGVFRPILAGATARDRIVACLGALIGIAATGLVSRWLMPGQETPALMLTASIGASAVLVFAVPASPLAQPWPVIGGCVISALSGILASRLIGDPMVAGAVAVALAIAAMSMARCLHPPGGGVALTAVLGGPEVFDAGAAFALVPAGLNAALLVGAAWLFHRVSGHDYPHRPAPMAAPESPAISKADIDLALSDLGEALDVSRDDLRVIAQSAADHAAKRVTRP